MNELTARDYIKYKKKKRKNYNSIFKTRISYLELEFSAPCFGIIFVAFRIVTYFVTRVQHGPSLVTAASVTSKNLKINVGRLVGVIGMGKEEK